MSISSWLPAAGIGRSALIALVVSFLTAAAAFWLYWPNEAPLVDAEVAVEAIVTETPALRSGEPTTPVVAPSLADLEELTPEAVIDNFDCKMLPGRGRANDTGLVILPTPDGARFAVLNGAGQVFGDTLPFMPNHYHLGKRADGTVVAGFGALRRNSEVFREKDTPEPVRIYADGQIIYQTDKAWEFAVASDGSSFYVQEPLVGGASRLIARNLDLGTEHHVDLGTEYTSITDSEPGFVVSYSIGWGEIMFFPAYAEAANGYGRGRHRFYPVDGGASREIYISTRWSDPPGTDGDGGHRIRLDGVGSALFASSEEGYFASYHKAASQADTYIWKIVRRAFQLGEQSTATEVWSREVAIPFFFGNMRLSDNGAWLMLRARKLLVLETATGETVFEYPMVDKQAQMARLANVMEPGASVADVGNTLGNTLSPRFRDNQLILSREIGSKTTCYRKNYEARAAGRYDPMQMRECTEDLRQQGVYRTVLDVFDMDTIELDSQPAFRIDFNRDNRCASGDYALRGLQVHEGRLTFLTNRRIAPTLHW